MNIKSSYIDRDILDACGHKYKLISCDNGCYLLMPLEEINLYITRENAESMINKIKTEMDNDDEMCKIHASLSNEGYKYFNIESNKYNDFYEPLVKVLHLSYVNLHKKTMDIIRTSVLYNFINIKKDNEHIYELIKDELYLSNNTPLRLIFQEIFNNIFDANDTLYIKLIIYNKIIIHMYINKKN